MTPAELLQLQDALKKQLEDTIAISIEKNVNGKIRAMDKKLDDYMGEDLKWKEADKEWKEAADPVIKMGTDLRGANKVIIYLAGFIAVLSGAVFAIVNIIKTFKLK